MVCAIGSCYDFTDQCNFRCSPSPATIQKYVKKEQQLDSSIGRLIPKAEMKIIAGLYTLVSRFLFNGTHVSNSVYACIHMGTRMEKDMKVIYRDAI